MMTAGNTHPFAGLQLGEYQMIMADPPWRYRTWSSAGQRKSPSRHYQVQDDDWIRSLPVADLAAADCILWLWATNPMLPAALSVMDAWGFTFKTAGHWVKQSRTGRSLAFGTGYLLRNAGEPFLIGTRGRPRTARDVRSVVMEPVRESGRKPDAAYEAASRMVLSRGPRLDLFSRELRDGWDAWGDEVGKFNERSDESESIQHRGRTGGARRTAPEQ